MSVQALAKFDFKPQIIKKFIDGMVSGMLAQYPDRWPLVN
jgi:5,10-methenyltetrahydromethanopterin hydrogenase